MQRWRGCRRSGSTAVGSKLEDGITANGSSAETPNVKSAVDASKGLQSYLRGCWATKLRFAAAEPVFLFFFQPWTVVALANSGAMLV